MEYIGGLPLVGFACFHSQLKDVLILFLATAKQFSSFTQAYMREEIVSFYKRYFIWFWNDMYLPEKNKENALRTERLYIPFFLLYEMYVCSYCIITTTIISGSSGVLDLDIQKYNRFFPKFKWSPFLTLFLPHELKLQNYIIFCETLFAVYTKTIMLLSISRCNFPKWPSRNSTTMVSSK